MEDPVNKKVVGRAGVQSSAMEERAGRVLREGGRGRQSVPLKVQQERRGNSGFWVEKVDGNTSFQPSALKRVETR